MKLDLTKQQAEDAIRAYLADPDPTAEVAIRLSPETPIRVTSSRDGGLHIWTGADSAPPKRPEKKDKSAAKGKKDATA